jgi:hypothetical protein
MTPRCRVSCAGAGNLPAAPESRPGTRTGGVGLSWIGADFGPPSLSPGQRMRWPAIAPRPLDADSLSVAPTCPPPTPSMQPATGRPGPRRWRRGRGSCARVLGRTAHDRTTRDVEAASVTRALDRGPVELPIAQGATTVGTRVVDGKDRSGHVREGDPRSTGAADPDRPKERDHAAPGGYRALLTDLEWPRLSRLDVGRARNCFQHR